MNEIQKHLVKLLGEIDQICKKNQILYVLSGRTARDAYKDQKFNGEYVYASVLMNREGFGRFREIVKKSANSQRAIESFYDNPNFPDPFSMRYVDEGTTFLYGHTAHQYKHLGIYITISYYEKFPTHPLKAKLVRGLNKIEKILCSGNRQNGWKKRIISIVGNLFGKYIIFNVISKFLNYLTKDSSSQEVYFNRNQKIITLPSHLFEHVKPVVFEGNSFQVPQDHDCFLRLVFGEDWNQEGMEDISARHLLVASTDVSYKEIDGIALTDQNGRATEALIQKQKKLAMRNRELRKSIEKNWDFLFVTHERFNMYRMYHPVLKLLDQMLVEKRYDDLAVLMAEYIDTLKRWAAKGLPLSICPEMDVIAVEVLKWMGEEKITEKFFSLREKVSFKPISINVDDETMMKAEQRVAELLEESQCQAVEV